MSLVIRAYNGKKFVKLRSYMQYDPNFTFVLPERHGRGVASLRLGETFWSVLQAYDWYDAGLVPTIIKGPNVYTAGYDKLYTCPDHVDSSQTSPGVCKKCKVELREDGTFKFPLWVDQATGEITRNFLVEDFK